MSFRHRILPERRRGALRRRLARGQNLRVIEAHSGLSALVASETRIRGSGFDGLWVSSLTGSTARGLPDMELYVIDRRLDLIAEIAAVTAKPILVDGDTGGDPTSLKYLCGRLEALGVSAIVVEDKRHPKRNSLSEVSRHALEDPAVFADKLLWARQGLASPDFMILARIESLVAGAGVADALERARIYLEAGVDGIMIHSKARSPAEVFAFVDAYRGLCRELGFARPLMCVPTTYNAVRTPELFERGFQIVVHANHLLRAAHFAMERACRDLLRHDRSLELDAVCTPVATLLETVGYDDEIERESATPAPRVNDETWPHDPRP